MFYLLKVSTVSVFLLRHCSVPGAVSARAVSSSFCYITKLYLEGFRCFGLFQQSALLFVSSLYYFFKVSIVSLSVSSMKLHHCSVLGFNSSIFCLLRHYTISSSLHLFRYLFYVNALFSASFVPSSLSFITILFSVYSRFALFHYLFVTSLILFSASIVPSSVYVSILILQDFHCFIIYL